MTVLISRLTLRGPIINRKKLIRVCFCGLLFCLPLLLAGRAAMGDFSPRKPGKSCPQDHVPLRPPSRGSLDMDDATPCEESELYLQRGHMNTQLWFNKCHHLFPGAQPVTLPTYLPGCACLQSSSVLPLLCPFSSFLSFFLLFRFAPFFFFSFHFPRSLSPAEPCRPPHPLPNAPFTFPTHLSPQHPPSSC